MSHPVIIGAVGLRGAGERYAPTPFYELSAKARALGLQTRADVEMEYAAAKFGWSKGTEYHCPFCGKDFISRSGARKHMRTQGCVVLRWDYYEGNTGNGNQHRYQA